MPSLFSLDTNATIFSFECFAQLVCTTRGKPYVFLSSMILSTISKSRLSIPKFASHIYQDSISRCANSSISEKTLSNENFLTLELVAEPQ
ncbi:hypothetical protein D3C78_803880 [compost metagenome]